jgi:hypothetical protein
MTTPFFKLILVNDNEGRCRHDNADVAMNKNGRCAIVWNDERNYQNLDIWCQLYDEDGKAIGSNFHVNDDADTYYDEQIQNDPSVAMDENGNFTVTWIDSRNGSSIYFRSFDRNGTPVNSSLQVINEPDSANMGTREFSTPKISMNPNGEFIITWIMTLDNENYLYYQAYTSDGVARGSNIKVEHVDKYLPESPVVAVNRNGFFAIAWTGIVDWRNHHVFFQLFDNTGAPLGQNNLINPDTTKLQNSPSITIDRSGNFAVAYIETENDNSSNLAIHCQRFDQDGTFLSSSFQVNNGPGGTMQNLPGIKADGQGNLVFTWRELVGSNYDIVAKRTTNAGVPLESQFKVNDNPHPCFSTNPAAACDSTGNFIVVWTDHREGHPNIDAQRYSNDGSLLDNNFIVNDDYGTASQFDPVLDIDEKGNCVVVWADTRHGNSDIYGQHLEKSGSLADGNFIINDDYITGTYDYNKQSKPDVAVDKDGNYVVVWEDYIEKIYMQRFTSDGTPSGNNSKVYNLSLARQKKPAIAMKPDGQFVVVWQEILPGSEDIYARFFGSDGQPGGDYFRVNEDILDSRQRLPAIAMNKKGDFVVVWEDERDGTDITEIYGQRFRIDGNPVGNNFKVGQSLLDDPSNSPDVAISDNGDFAVVWEAGGIYCQRYDSSGVPLDSNFLVLDRMDDYNTYYPAVSIDTDGSFVISWIDNRTIDENYLYYQLYDPIGIPLGLNINTNQAIKTRDTLHPLDLVFMNRQFYLTWSDTKIEGQAFDIFAMIGEINFPPYSPVLFGPETNIFIDDTTITLHFSIPDDVEDDALHFKVEIAKDNGFTDPIPGSPFESIKSRKGYIPEPPLLAAGDSCSYTLQSLLDDGTFFWRISAVDPGFQSRPSAVSIFHLDTQAPYTEEHYPPKEAQNVSVSDSISVHIKDQPAGVDLSSIVVHLNGEEINPVISGDSLDYLITYNPPVPFGHDEQILIGIDARDNVGHEMKTDSLSFRTEGEAFVEENQNRIPLDFVLHKNFPNPFNPSTMISYDLPIPIHVQLNVFDLHGRTVCCLVDKGQQAGTYSISWNGRDMYGSRVASGVYFCILRVENSVFRQKMILLK